MIGLLGVARFRLQRPSRLRRLLCNCAYPRMHRVTLRPYFTHVITPAWAHVQFCAPSGIIQALPSPPPHISNPNPSNPFQLFDGSTEALSTLASLFPDHAPHAPTSFCSVATGGHLIAAAAATPGLLALWDVRTAHPVGLFSAASHSLWQHAPPALHLEGHKLVLGFGSGIAVHDLRAVSERSCSWPRVVRTLGVDGEAGAAQLQCMACYGSYVLAGVAGAACSMWAFGRSAASVCAAVTQQQEQHGDDDRRKQDKDKKAPRRNNRFPKRTSR